MTMPRSILICTADKKLLKTTRQLLAHFTLEDNLRIRDCSRLLPGSRRRSLRAFATRSRDNNSSFQFDEWLAANPLPTSRQIIDDRQTSSSSRIRVRNDESEELGFSGKLESMSGIWWESGDRGKFSWRDTSDIFYECLQECGQMVWNNKHKCFVQVNSKTPLVFVPPTIQLPMSATCTASEYLKLLRENNEQRRYLLALVSSSAAALGVFQDDALVLHKVITAYTVRAKQGKAQLHYLRQGGPGRMSVGGGLRARETERLFSRICEKLGEWQKDIEGCKYLFYSGNMRVWNEVYACNDPKLSVARDDIRWLKVPYSVRQPRLRELHRVYYGLSHGAVRIGQHFSRSWVECKHLYDGLTKGKSVVFSSSSPPVLSPRMSHSTKLGGISSGMSHSAW